ncbi:MAG: xanthine dehydrogenase accessory protein XdhC [Pseudomonadota bacterium]|nr:xanthine dehydrogenase accessory protein XdhC [Pseudomonadota bacterium]
MPDYFEIFSELKIAKIPFVEIVLVAARGSTPSNAGARAIVGLNGLLCGTIGGGKVEAKAITRAVAMLSASNPDALVDFVVWNLQTDVGMTCGGEVKFYFEIHNHNAWKIAVFGAGHVAQALIPLLVTLDCAITCIDSREEWLKLLPPSPKLKTVCASRSCDHVKELSTNTQFVVMTQGHATDVPILKEILSTRTAPFVGVIGSHAKFLVLKGELVSSGLPEEKISKIHCPIGLPVGSSSPSEIAVSIVAQLLMVRDGEDFSGRKWQKLIHKQTLNLSSASVFLPRPQPAETEIQSELET